MADHRLDFSHPDAKYFNVGRIERDQLEDYARRKGEALEVTERWLASQLAYEPAEFGEVLNGLHDR
jgi:5-methyltetrahydrofolate--homocysteine methyltransferase